VSDRREVNVEAKLTQLDLELPHAPRRPQQHLHRIATTVRRDQSLERHNQLRIGFADRIAPTTRPTHIRPRVSRSPDSISRIPF